MTDRKDPRGWANPSRHAGHRRTVRVRTGAFAGKRLSTRIERCRTCGGVVVALDQIELRRGEAIR